MGREAMRSYGGTCGRIREEHGRNIRVEFVEAKLTQMSEFPCVSALQRMKPTLQMFSLLFSSLIALTVGSIGAEPQEPLAEKKDVAEETKSPLDQSNKPEDLKVTQAIRKAVIADGALSLNAKNVRIITAEGTVTLAGKVNSTEENDKIVAYAKQSAGTAQVINQMEVKAEQP